MPRKLFLLDAMALIYRAHFVFINNPRVTSKGVNTSAVFGFTNTLLEILDKERPTHIGVAFDPEGPTFRHEQYEQYKAHRDPAPEELIAAIPMVKELLRGMGIPVLELPGFEADDVMGTLACRAEEEGFDEIFLMTPDKDHAQLVTDRVKLYRPGNMGKPAEKFGRQEVIDKFGVPPELIADLLGLKGDASDNIPGVPKIGEKTALELILAYGSLEQILASTEHITKKAVKASLEENAELGRISKDLATIRTDLPIALDPLDLIISRPDPAILEPLFKELELKTLAKRILGRELDAPTVGQGDLFAAPPVATPQAAMPFAGDEAAEGSYKTIKDVTHDYQYIETAAERAEVIAELLSRDKFCFDTETTGLDAMEADIVGLALSIEEGQGWFVTFPADFEEAREIFQTFQPVFARADKLKIAQNLKYDLTVLRRYGVTVEPPFADTMLMHYLVRSDGKHGMDALSRSYLSYDPVSIEELIGKKGKGQITMREVAPQIITDYACEDADITLQLYNKLNAQVDELQVRGVLENIEQPLVPVLAAMEWEGIRVDVPFLAEYSKQLDYELGQLEDQCYKLAGEHFNLNSPKQLGVILFEKLMIGGKPKKTATGQYATDEETLTALAGQHELPAYLLAYRQLTKLKGTYVDALPVLLNRRTGRVHTSFNQAVAVTGRLSSNNPNIQNIPIRTDRGKEVRRAFVSRGEGWQLLSADYSQIELRIMAHLSGDQNMKEAFLAGEDIHRATAARIFGVSKEEVDSDMRRKAKTANFGIIYGITPFGLSQRLNIPRSEANDIINGYFAQYPGVKAFMDGTVNYAREHGNVRTLTGRIHHLPNIKSSNPTVRGFTERNAINTPIQGSAADLIKLAMIRLHHELNAQGYQARMLLQVHDELLFDVPEGELEKLKPLVRDCMENAMALSVPLEVDMGAATNWLDAH